VSLRFRKQALAAQAAPHLGAIRAGHNPRFTSIAAASVIVCAALVAFAMWTSVTRKTRLPGILVPTLGTLDLTASHTGTLLEVMVKEGDEVDAGQTLLRIGTDRRSRNGDTSALVMDSLSQRRAALHAERLSAIAQARHRDASLAERLRNMHIEHQQAHDELKALQTRLALARRTVERFEQLSGDGFVSAVVVQQKHEELIDLGLRERAAQRGLTTLTRDAQTVRAEQTASSAALRVQLAQLDRQQSALDQESIEVDARSEVALLAPRPGVISSLSLHPGQSVQAGQTMITLVPRTPLGTPSPLEAQLYAPSRTVGFLQPGQSVWLRYAAYPYQKFGMAQARIVSVSRTPINPQDLPAGHAQSMLQAARSHEPLYRITASLASQVIRTYGADHTLRPGMALDAHVIQDRRAVWEWLLDPLLATASGQLVPGR
jgi:membrane fusion protein